MYLAKNQEQYKIDQQFISGMEFSKWLNNVYTKTNDQWIKDVSSKAVKKAIMNGEIAFKRFFKQQSKFPRYKKKRNNDVQPYFINGNGNIKLQRHRIQIPTIGWVKLKEFGYVPLECVKSCTISYEAGRYFVSALCDVSEVKTKYIQSNSNDGIGVDLGLKDFAICSNANIFRNINKSTEVKKLSRSLKRQQRKFSRKLESAKKNKTKKGKAKNIAKQMLIIQKLHKRLSNKRQEYVRYVVNCLVKTKPKHITIEDLNVKGMMKNRHLSNAVAEQNFYYFKTHLTDKCNQYGIELRMVDRFYPSSKMCSCCGEKKVDLKLSDRTFNCPSCGITIDRDFNASLNLKYAKEYTVITS